MKPDIEAKDTKKNRESKNDNALIGSLLSKPYNRS